MISARICKHSHQHKMVYILIDVEFKKVIGVITVVNSDSIVDRDTKGNLCGSHIVL